MKFYIYTFGCKVNGYESEFIAQSLTDAGFERVSDAQSAEVFIVNSCTVTGYSDKKTRQLIHRLRREKSAVIVLTGCLPQASERLGAVLPDADIITGTQNRSALADLIRRFVAEGKRITDIPPLDSRYFEPMCCREFAGKTRASIKIQDGCDNFCTYCIIPHTRGRIRSKPIEALRAEASALTAAGYREIVLTGINLSAYGADMGLRLYDAVEACVDGGAKRIRLGSLETEGLNDETLNRLAKTEELCPHFHLSLQSGSDKILGLMNRKYDFSQYAKLCDGLNALFDNCAITTDIIVGFPCEDADDFARTLGAIEQIGFADMHIFPYSVREGTKAAAMPQLPDIVKTQRAEEAERIAAAARIRYLEKQTGKRLEVLFEHENDEAFHRGHSRNYCRVLVKQISGEKSLQNELKCVKIIGHDDFTLFGDIDE